MLNFLLAGESQGLTLASLTLKSAAAFRDPSPPSLFSEVLRLLSVFLSPLSRCFGFVTFTDRISPWWLLICSGKSDKPISGKTNCGICRSRVRGWPILGINHIFLAVLIALVFRKRDPGTRGSALV